MHHRRAIIFLNRALAVAVRNRIDGKLGFPRPGVNVGNGLHAPPIFGRTVRSSRIYQHPTLARYALRMNARLRAAWEAVKADAQARIAAGQAQTGDAVIVATNEADRDSAWDNETQGDD